MESMVPRDLAARGEEIRYDRGRRVAGTYAILCRASGRAYFGSSHDVYYRLCQHKNLLRAGTHHAPHLQRAWRLYGPNAWAFLLMDRMPGSDERARVERENYYLLGVERTMLYNAQVPATIGAPLGTRHTDEARRKMSAARVGKVQSEETKAKRRATLAGRVFSDEHRANLAAALAGRVMPPRSEAAKAATSRTMKALDRDNSGERNGNAKKLDPDKVREIRRLYAEKILSQDALAERFGVPQEHISRIVRREAWKSVE